MATHRQMDEWTDGRMDKWRDGWTDRQTDLHCILANGSNCFRHSSYHKYDSDYNDFIQCISLFFPPGYHNWPHLHTHYNQQSWLLWDFQTFQFTIL